jgi:hypothetical protein
MHTNRFRLRRPRRPLQKSRVLIRPSHNRHAGSIIRLRRRTLHIFPPAPQFQTPVLALVYRLGDLVCDSGRDVDFSVRYRGDDSLLQ